MNATIPVFLPTGDVDVDVSYTARRGSYGGRYEIYVYARGADEYVGWVIRDGSRWGAWLSGRALDLSTFEGTVVSRGETTRADAVAELLRELAARRPFSGPLAVDIERAIADLASTKTSR